MISAEFYLFRTVPQIAPLDISGNYLNPGMNLDQILFALAINNLGTENLAVGRLTFRVLSEGADCSNFRLWQEFVGVIGEGSIDGDGYVVVDLFDPLVVIDDIVNSGERLWLLSNVQVDQTNPGATVSTRLVHDMSFSTPMPATYTEAASQCYFLWSDLSESGPLGVSDPELYLKSQWNGNNRVQGTQGPYSEPNTLPVQ